MFFAHHILNFDYDYKSTIILLSHQIDTSTYFTFKWMIFFFFLFLFLVYTSTAFVTIKIVRLISNFFMLKNLTRNNTIHNSLDSSQSLSTIDTKLLNTEKSFEKLLEIKATRRTLSMILLSI